MLNTEPKQFPECGYCLYRDVFDQAQVEKMRHALQVATLAGLGGLPKYYSEPHTTDAFWLETCIHPRLLDAVESILGPNLILVFSSMFIKQPRDDNTVCWHQDNTYWPSVHGTDVITLPRERLPAYRRRMGVVFQDFRLVDHLSAFDNVALPLRVSGVREADLQGPVADMLEWVGLAHRADARPATLSGGEQQRVAIARAVIGRPDMLVADEPTGNVDPEMALKLIRLFEALNRLGTTVVVATHDVHLLSKVPDSLIMRLDKGVLSDPTGALRYPPRRIGAGE